MSYLENIDQDHLLAPLISSLNKVSEDIYSFVNTEQKQDILKTLRPLIFSASNTICEINQFLSMNKFMNSLSNKIQNCIPEQDNIDVLSLRFYDVNIELRSMSLIIESVINIYERLCSIASVSTSEYNLIPIKIESGSFFEKLAGHKGILKIMESVFVKTAAYMYRNFTSEGKLSSDIKYEALRKELDLIKEFENHGFNVNEAKNIAEETLVILCMDVQQVLRKSSKIKINEHVLDFKAEIATTLLGEGIKYIETPSNTSETSEDVSDS